MTDLLLPIYNLSFIIYNLNIAPFSLILLIWTSTVGINLQAVYCYCKKEWKVSLFEISDNCSEKMKVKTMPCCKSMHGCPKNRKPAVRSLPCDKTEVQYLKLDSKFVKAGKETTPWQPLPAPAQLSPPHTGLFSTRINLCTPSNKAPPRPFGRALLSRIQILTC